MIDVTLGKRDAAAKIPQACCLDPGIVLRPAGQALLMNLRREHLGKRRTDPFLPRRPAREIYICVAAEAYARQHVFERPELLARQANGERQRGPRFHATGRVPLIIVITVMIKDAGDPPPAGFAVGAV